MKRTDPATDLVERSIRQWQISGSKAARHDLVKETDCGRERGPALLVRNSSVSSLGRR
jgi:hypothetical protein